jgi:hypothetical protein
MTRSTALIGDPAGDHGRGGGEVRQLLIGAGERVGPVGDQVGRVPAVSPPRKRAPATVYRRRASSRLIACSGPRTPAGVARVVMPPTARSGLSGPIGWSVPALIQAPASTRPRHGNNAPVRSGPLDRDVHAEAGGARDVAADEAAVLDHEHPGRRVGDARAGVTDGVE